MKYFILRLLCTLFFAFIIFVKILDADNSFGKKESAAFIFKGSVYKIAPSSKSLPDFNTLKPLAVIYTDQLNVPDRDFNSGFPGFPELKEWFAIDYHGIFFINEPGKYSFALSSDDGSKLYIDDKLIIDHDGIHSAINKYGSVELIKGVHKIRVQFFQGPAFKLALVLKISRGVFFTNYKVFKISDYMPTIIKEEKDFFRISMNEQVLFDFNKYLLNKQSKVVLEQVIKHYIHKIKYKKIIIEGHTDDIGSKQYNKILSLKRARSVKDWLCKRGLLHKKIIIKGYGMSKPKYPNINEKNRAANRRIEIILIK